MKFYLKKLFLFALFIIASTSAHAETEAKSYKQNGIVLLGAVPVLASFIFAIGKGDLIQNSLPLRFLNTNISNTLYENITRAKEKNLPIYEFDGNVNLELLLKNNPKYIFTMDQVTAQNLSKRGFNAFFLSWKNQEDVEKLMLSLADILDAKEQENNYMNYTHYVTNTIQNRLKAIRLEDRPKVLCFDYKTMTTPHHIIDSWIEKSGGLSVTKSDRVLEKVTFSQEQLLMWNPDIIIVNDSNDLENIYKNKKFTSVSAIKNKKVFISPRGIHLWANRTAELPLMQLWAAKTFHPKVFQNIDIKKESLYFYKNLIGYELSTKELNEILNISEEKKEKK